MRGRRILKLSPAKSDSGYRRMFYYGVINYCVWIDFLLTGGVVNDKRCLLKPSVKPQAKT
jgi:hypothetical protein